MDHAITADRLTRIFGNTMAVDRMSFTIPKGKVVGFLGQNGAGKSTTIKMLLGLLRPSAGKGSLLGHDSQNLPPSIWNRIGNVEEDSRMYDWMKVGSLIQYTSAFYSNWDHAFAGELLKKLELPANQKVKTLSRGQRWKVALLLALAFRPELLVLDDPVSGLDPIVRHEFLEQIIELLQMEGRTIFFSSHILDEVERIADHIIIVRKGKVIVSESLEKLKASVKRVSLVFEEEVKNIVLPGALHLKQEGRIVTATYADFSESRRAEIDALRPRQFETEDLNLSQIFVELAREQK